MWTPKKVKDFPFKPPCNRKSLHLELTLTTFSGLWEKRGKKQLRKGKTKIKASDSLEQLVTEGAETLQTSGKVMALVIFRVTPKEALLLKASHRHSGSAFSTVFKPEQHDRS